MGLTHHRAVRVEPTRIQYSGVGEGILHAELAKISHGEGRGPSLGKNQVADQYLRLRKRIRVMRGNAIGEISRALQD